MCSAFYVLSVCVTILNALGHLTSILKPGEAVCLLKQTELLADGLIGISIDKSGKHDFGI